MPSARNLLVYAVLVLAALGSGWLAEQLTPKEPAGSPKEPGKIDYYSVNVLRTITDERGRPKHLLYAERLTHFQNDDHSELERPVLTIYAEDGPPWVIHGERGLVTAKGSEVFLEGAVLVLRDANSKGRTIRAETSNVRIRPDEQYGETAELVQISSPPDYLSGVGMQVHFGKALKVSVLADVHRKHDVQPSPNRPSARNTRPKSVRRR
jgi:lipopolysaccharide export system protein LptC